MHRIRNMATAWLSGLLVFTGAVANCLCADSPAEEEPPMPALVVFPDVECAIDPRLFGQFLERPSWAGETGPECCFEQAPPHLPAAVVDMLRQMRIPGTNGFKDTHFPNFSSCTFHYNANTAIMLRVPSQAHVRNVG